MKSLSPNMRKLAIERLTQIQIERAKKTGATGFGLVAQVAARMKDHLATDAREANQWVRNAVSAVRTAPGGHVYRDDEHVAGELVAQIEARSKRS